MPPASSDGEAKTWRNPMSYDVDRELGAKLRAIRVSTG